MKTINEFRGKYYFLSNFYEAPVMYKGLLYDNNESAFQSVKVTDVIQRKRFCNLTPNLAKALGRKVVLRKDWEEIKDIVMEDIIRDKFTRNEDLKQKLIETGDSILIEGNDWNDKYWGMCNGSGQNKLGQILMKIRNELRT